MSEMNNGNQNADETSYEQGLEQAIGDASEAIEAGEVTEDAAVAALMDSIDSGEFEATADEESAMADPSPETETGEQSTTTGATGAKTPPAYQAFIAAVQVHGVALGLSFKEQKGFYQFGSPSTGHRLYVAKQGRGVTRVDTTLPRTALQVNGKDISLPLTKPNGRVACHVDPTVESVNAALEILATHKDKIAAPKKATKAA